MASAFVFMPFLIARFGLDDYGLFLLVGSLSGYLGLLDLGVGASLIKYVAEHRAKGETRELSETVSTALVFYAVIGVLASVILVVIGLFMVQLFKLPPSSQDLARNLFLVGAATSLLSWPLSTANYVLGGLQRYDITARATVIAVIANIAVTAGVLIAGQGPLALLVGTSVVGLAVAFANARFAVRELGTARFQLSAASWNRLKQIFKFSSVVFVMQLASMLIYQQTDRLVLGVFVGTAAIGLYEAASKLHSLVRQLAGLSASAVMPAASQLDAEERRDTLVKLYMRGTKYTVIFVTPIVVTIMVLAEPLLRVWLGPEFVVMAVGAQIYVSYWLLNANTTVSGGILMGTNKLRFLLWYTIIGAVSNVVVSVVLVNLIGINGVIIGTVLPYYVGFPIYLRYCAKHIGFRVADWFQDVVRPTYPFLVLTAAIAIGARLIGFDDTLLKLGIASGLSVLAYWAAIYGFGLTDAERADAHAVVGAVRRRIGLA